VRAPLVQPAAAAKSSKAGNDAGSPPAAPKPRGRPRKSKPPPAVDMATQQQQQQQQEPVLFPGAERMDLDVIQTASREQRQQAEIAIQVRAGSVPACSARPSVNVCARLSV